MSSSYYFTAAHSRIRSVLVITTLPELLRLDMATAILRLSRGVSDMISTGWYRNINLLPIHGLLLKGPLRPGLTPSRIVQNIEIHILLSGKR